MKVSVSGKQFVFPRQCACCGSYPLTYLPISGAERNRLARTRGWVWEIPYCTACRRHVRSLLGVKLAALFLVAASAATASFTLALTSDWAESLLVLLLALTFTGALALGSLMIIRTRASKNCCGLGPTVYSKGSEGPCHTFEFRSKFYAAEFVRANHKKVVNVTPEVASILRNTSFGSHQVPRRLIRKRSDRN